MCLNIRLKQIWCWTLVTVNDLKCRLSLTERDNSMFGRRHSVDEWLSCMCWRCRAVSTRLCSKGLRVWLEWSSTFNSVVFFMRVINSTLFIFFVFYLIITAFFIFSIFVVIKIIIVTCQNVNESLFYRIFCMSHLCSDGWLNVLVLRYRIVA